MQHTIRSILKKVMFAVPVALVLLNQVYAQTASTDSLNIRLDEIRVEAAHSSISVENAPLSVSYLIRNAADMTARPASSMDDLTFTLPGIWISDRENQALGERMSIRGMGWRSPFGVRGIQVILDDIPLTVADGQTILNMVDPAMVQSLELLRGPSATFWGNSSGGVLYMRTRQPADAPALSLRSYAGSYNTMKHEVRWHNRIAGVRWNAYGSYYGSDGYRDHSESRLIRGGLSAGFDLGENSTLDARIAYSGMPKAQHPGSLPADEAQNNPSMAWPAFADARAGKDFQQLMASGAYNHDFENGLLSVSAHGIYRDFNNPLLPSVGYISVGRYAGGSRATYDVESLPFYLQFGGELKWQYDDRSQHNTLNGEPGDEVWIDQNDMVRNQALFAKAIFDFRPLSLSLGLRGDRMVFAVEDFIAAEESDRVFTSLNPSIGLNLNLNNTRLFANLSTSFESPTTTEFKNRPGGGTGFNPDLMPEKTVGLETGIRGVEQNLNLEYDITLFGLRVSDLIIPFEEEDGGPTLFRNEGDTRHYGLETHFRFYPVQQLSLEMMYTWVHAVFNDGDFDGNKVPGVAPHRIGSSLSFSLGKHTFIADAEWVGKYFADSDNTASNDAYFLLDGRWTFSGLRFNTWQIKPFVSVDNLLNERYNTSVSINAFGGRFYEPGRDRSFRAGLQVDLF